MSRAEIEQYAQKSSKTSGSAYSPWKDNFDSMAKKTVIKQLLKYAPLRTDIEKAISLDESIKTRISEDMSEVENEQIIDVDTDSAT